MATSTGSSGDDIIVGTTGSDNLSGGAGSDDLSGGAGSDFLNGGSGDDILNGGSGSDILNGGSGNDTLVYNLTENTDAKDVYTGGSGIDTILVQLTNEQWLDSDIRAQLESYVHFLETVRTNQQGEVSNGSVSDFIFRFADGATLTVQMMEKLVIAVQTAPGGPYDVIDHLQSLVSGTATGSVIEAGGVNNGTPGSAIATGDLYADDLDGLDDVFIPQAGVVKTYGTFSIDASGAWSYTLDDNNAAVQGLNTGDTLTETVTVATADGTTKDVTITINGANDAAVITGTASDSVTEKSGVLNGTAGDASASGDLDATDVDSSAAFAVQAGVVKTYGTFSIDASGAWSYTLDDNNAAVQGLNTGDTLTETVTVATADGTTKDVTITINGANDAPIALADANLADTVTESGVMPGNTPYPGDATAS